MSKVRILIVDDDAPKMRSLAALLNDAGFAVACVDKASAVLAELEETPPHIVLIELWLAEMDGIDILQMVKSRCAHIAVIMMSGHGSIAAAVRTVQLGAFDFLEKPLAAERVLDTVSHAVRHLHPAISSPPLRLAQTGFPSAHPQVATSPWTASSTPQRTLRRSVVLRGQGLQSGEKTGVILSPLPPGSGIVFRDLATGDTLPATVEYVASTAFCTNLQKGRVRVGTIEHAMSAFHAFGLTNLLVTLSDEMPIMDGSAAEYCRLIAEAGVIAQDAMTESYTVERCYHIGGRSLQTKFIRIDPYDGLRVTYRAHYPEPIGLQEWTYEHRDGASYSCEVAPARTFAFVKDVEAMHAAGLVAGGRLNNVILIGETQIVNTTPLRFANECVRHKVLDIIGDLYLLGMPIRGHVRANMTGHTENVELVRQLRQTVCPT